MGAGVVCVSGSGPTLHIAGAQQIYLCIFSLNIWVGPLQSRILSKQNSCDYVNIMRKTQVSYGAENHNLINTKQMDFIQFRVFGSGIKIRFTNFSTSLFSEAPPCVASSPLGCSHQKWDSGSLFVYSEGILKWFGSLTVLSPLKNRNTHHSCLYQRAL